MAKHVELACLGFARAPPVVNGKRSTGGLPVRENLQLVTSDISSSAYRDHGAILFADESRPWMVNSIAGVADGAVYSTAAIVNGASYGGTG